jgi:Microtubule-binding stalk of dynein motor
LKETQNKLKKIMQHPEFTPVGMEPKAARVICTWIIAIHKYAIVYDAAAPKRDKVNDSTSKLDQSQKVSLS